MKANLADSQATNSVSQVKMLAFIKWIIDAALEGFGPFSSASKLANSYFSEYKCPEKAIKMMIKAEIIKAASSGALIGLPGFIALPFTLPGTIGSDYFFSARLIAAIAHLRGWNLNTKRVYTLILLCMLGVQGKKYVKNVSLLAASRAANVAINRASVSVLQRKLGIKVGANLVKNTWKPFVKGIPIIGSIIGATIDVFFLLACVNSALRIFKPQGEKPKISGTSPF